MKLGKENIQLKIQLTSVTQLLWFLVMGKNPSEFNRPENCIGDHLLLAEVPLCPRHPAERVSWNQIAEKDESGQYKEGTFLRTLKDQFGIDARLPTEAERERAARGVGTQAEMFDLTSSFYRPYYFGQAGEENLQVESPVSANFNLSAHSWWSKNSNRQTHRIGDKGWNSLGLDDMSGNVWEWVEDWYSEEYDEGTREHPLENPTGPKNGYERSLRCSSWYSLHPGSLRSAHRSHDFPASLGDGRGFRLLIEVPTAQ